MNNNQTTGKIEWIKPELIVVISEKQHSIEGKFVEFVYEFTDYNVQYGPLSLIHI